MANTKKRWTAEEIDILKKYYPTEGDAVFERLPGRTAKSCRIQASKLKISKNISSAIIQDDRKYIRLWTKAEDEILREYYAEEGSNVRCRLNQRSAESCRGRAAALGLVYSGANRKWSSREDEILKKYYSTEGAEIQKRLHERTKEACNKRAAKLGLRMQGRKKWSAEEDEIIKTYYKAEGGKVAERLEGRTLSACQSRAKYLNVKSDNNRIPWTQEEDDIITRYYEEKGAEYVHRLIPERSPQACRYRAMTLGLSTKNNESWTKAEEKILKKYYPAEGSNVYKRFNGRTRNACISKSAQLHLQYGPTMYKGPALDEWIISAVKQGITKINRSMTYSEIILKSGELPELHLKMEYDKTGKLKIYEDSVLSNEKKYHIQQVEKLADTMKLQIKENKMIVNSSEKNAGDDAIRLIVGCYLVYFSYDS